MGDVEGNPCRDQRNDERIGAVSIAPPRAGRRAFARVETGREGSSRRFSIAPPGRREPGPTASGETFYSDGRKLRLPSPNDPAIRVKNRWCQFPLLYGSLWRRRWSVCRCCSEEAKFKRRLEGFDDFFQLGGADTLGVGSPLTASALVTHDRINVGVLEVSGFKDSSERVPEGMERSFFADAQVNLELRKDATESGTDALAERKFGRE